MKKWAWILFLMSVEVLADATGFDKAVKAFESQDYAQALNELRPLAQNGDAQSQYAMGMMYENGFGVEKNLNKALEWYTKAAQQNNTDAQYNLGVMYEKAIGVKQDYAQAAQWYRKAAAQGDIDAFNNLGFLYQQGFGVTQNKVAALALYNVSVYLETHNPQASQAAQNRQLLANQMTLDEVQAALTLTGQMTQSTTPITLLDQYLAGVTQP